MLRAWKQAYLDNRAYIEKSGVGSRWEFDKGVLFNAVDHITRICDDIAGIGRQFVEYENLFGCRMKTIVYDPSIVDEIMKKVYRLLEDILKVDYDIFKPSNWENWEATLDYFNKKMGVVEGEAKTCIDHCISTLRSSDLGLELMNDVEQFNTSDSLSTYLTSKIEILLRFFVTEVNQVEHEFNVSG